MNRRDMLAGFVSAGVVAGGVPGWFRAATGQQQPLPVIGILDVVRGRFAIEANRGLAENGFVEGKNFKFEIGHSEYRADLLAMNAAELVQRKVALILACSNRAALAAKSITSTTPIIFLAADPTAGLVDRLTRPGGNLTGVANPDSALIARRIEIARELVPAMNLVVLVTDPTNNPAHDIEIREAQTAAKALGLELSIIAWTGGSFEIELAALPRDRKAVLVFGGGPLFLVHGAQLDYLARRYEIPAIHGSREAVEEGALVSFGARFSDGGHLMGVYAARVLKGDKPADLPVRPITRTELVINLWGAKSLGIKVCPPLLARADEVIG